MQLNNHQMSKSKEIYMLKMINSDTHRLRVVHVKKFKILKIEVLSEEKSKI